MINAAVDPVVLLPPVDPAGVDAWVLEISEVAELLASPEFDGTCPRELQEIAYARWWDDYQRMQSDLQSIQSPHTTMDLMQVWEQLRGRLAESPLPEGETVAFDVIRTSPTYVAGEFTASEQEAFGAHLGEVALRRRDDGVHGLVVTVPESWSDDPSGIEIEATIGLLGTPDGDILAPADAGVREYLDGCTSLALVYATLARHPYALVEHPELAVRVSCVVDLGANPSNLEFDLAEEFVPSLRSMGYNRSANSARAASCFRAMAHIACGRAADLTSLQAHPHHRGGGGGAPVRDPEGRILYRGALFMGSNAHRLFWWGGERPQFVGATGHDDPPPCRLP